MVPAPFLEAITTLISSGDLTLLLSSLQTPHWSVGEVCDVLVGVALCVTLIHLTGFYFL